MRKLAVFCLALVLFAVGCKKSVEGESKTWKRANQTVDELAVLYPGFKAALEAQRTAAKTAMDAAEAVSDKKEKISKMASANSMLTGGFVGQLAAVDGIKKKLREQVVEVTGQATDPNDRLSIQKASTEVERALAEVDAALKTGAGSPAEASVVLKKVTADLESAEKILAQVGKVATDKQAAAAAEKAEAEKAAAAKAEADKPPAPWKCQFCDTENAPEATTCGNCGADRGGAK